MNEQKATEILGDYILPSGDLTGAWDYVSWGRGSDTAILDGEFTAEQLEALTWWIRNKK